MTVVIRRTDYYQLYYCETVCSDRQLESQSVVSMVSILTVQQLVVQHSSSSQCIVVLIVVRGCSDN